ncbi:MAG: hypothetical protein IJ763_09870 [Lachnospiraceae bacterium]|nr:hypothetical protein [Lachnospiraceae bacterium]
MAEKDIAEKLLEDYNDVFADIVNVLLFDGQERVNPESLTNTKDKSQYKADDSTLHEQERGCKARRRGFKTYAGAYERYRVGRQY